MSIAYSYKYMYMNIYIYLYEYIHLHGKALNMQLRKTFFFKFGKRRTDSVTGLVHSFYCLYAVSSENNNRQLLEVARVVHLITADCVEQTTPTYKLSLYCYTSILLLLCSVGNINSFSKYCIVLYLLCMYMYVLYIVSVYCIYYVCIVCTMYVLYILCLYYIYYVCMLYFIYL